jgi:hypothetical protein
MRLGFSQKLHEAGETLDLSLHRTTSSENEHYDYTNEVFVPPGATFYNNLGFHEERSTSEFAADYVLPIAKTRTLKAGYSFEQDNFEYGAAGNNVDPVSLAQIPDPNLTDDFKFRQQIHAVYSSYQAALGAWSWLFGLRGELTGIRSQQLNENLSADRSYLRLYPSLHIDRSISDQSTL